jgi:HEAT repeat protein
MQKESLRDLILRSQVFEAVTLAREMGGVRDEVLRELIPHEDARVRRDVLEVAAELDDASSGRLVLGALEDPDGEVQTLAAALVDVCGHRELLPDLLEAIEKHDESGLRGDLALQIGSVGGAPQIPTLREYLRGSVDDSLRRKLQLALARLGDEAARQDLIRRLENGDAGVRFDALQDCLYVQDRSLAEHFGPALQDYREIIELTVPEDPVDATARICDSAVTVMQNLGYAFTFSAEDLWVRSEAELEEARAIVSGLAEAEQ